jgi:hypothetical protein
MPAFVPALEVSRRFYEEVVRPLLDASYPGLTYAAALIGSGSEILGFDSGMSMDHDWGVRLFLFLKEEDAHRREAIATVQLWELRDKNGNPLGLWL